LSAPFKPSVGKPVKNLPAVVFCAVFGQFNAGILGIIADFSPFFPFVDFIFGDSCLTEVFLRDYIRCNLAPERRYNDGIFGKNRFAVRVSDFAFTPLPNNIKIRTALTISEKTLNFHPKSFLFY
jgi:hypothetical protein